MSLKISLMFIIVMAKNNTINIFITGISVNLVSTKFLEQF